MIINADGKPIGIGRSSRKIPHWLERQVLLRDKHCRFPGCTRISRLHSHHIVHWADGGTTDLDNLLTLCQSHHHAIHRDGWRLAGTVCEGIEWERPNGTIARHGPQPPPWDHAMKERFAHLMMLATVRHLSGARHRNHVTKSP